VNSLPKTVTGQRSDCDLNSGSSAPECNTLTTRLPSHPHQFSSVAVVARLRCGLTIMTDRVSDPYIFSHIGFSKSYVFHKLASLSIPISSCFVRRDVYNCSVWSVFSHADTVSHAL